jgi:hypothetical protein
MGKYGYQKMKKIQTKQGGEIRLNGSIFVKLGDMVDSSGYACLNRAYVIL